MLHQLRTARALLASDPSDAIGTAAVLVLFAGVSPFLVLMMEAFCG